MPSRIPSTIRRWIGPALALALGLAACAPASAPAPTPAPTPAFGVEDVAHVVALDKMAGHLRVSLILWEAGHYELAVTHSAHPVAELYSLVEGDLKAKNADTALRSALDAYAGLAGAAGEAVTIKAAHQAALDAIRAAEQTLAGSLLDSAAFGGEVVHGLLQGVEAEYAEAVEGGRITRLVEYQDALGFLGAARARYVTIEAQVKIEHAHEHELIEAQFVKLEAGFPDAVTPPSQPVEPDEVEEHVDLLVAELGEAVGLRAETDQSPAEIVAAIRE